MEAAEQRAAAAADAVKEAQKALEAALAKNESLEEQLAVELKHRRAVEQNLESERREALSQKQFHGSLVPVVENIGKKMHVKSRGQLVLEHVALDYLNSLSEATLCDGSF